MEQPPPADAAGAFYLANMPPPMENPPKAGGENLALTWLGFGVWGLEFKGLGFIGFRVYGELGGSMKL